MIGIIIGSTAMLATTTITAGTIVRIAILTAIGIVITIVVGMTGTEVGTVIAATTITIGEIRAIGVETMGQTARMEKIGGTVGATMTRVIGMRETAIGANMVHLGLRSTLRSAS